MYLRLIVLLVLFNRTLAAALFPAFLALAALAISVGWFWSRRPDATSAPPNDSFESKNPLQLTTAFLFALLFVAMLVATQLAVPHMGRAGLNALAAIMGIVDVDPFVMGMTQSAGSVIPIRVAASAIVIASSSNNLAKGIYALSFGDKETGLQSLRFLGGLSLLGLAPLLWL